jgi:hypothetical protein
MLYIVKLKIDDLLESEKVNYFRTEIIYPPSFDSLPVCEVDPPSPNSSNSVRLYLVIYSKYSS